MIQDSPFFLLFKIWNWSTCKSRFRNLNGRIPPLLLNNHILLWWPSPLFWLYRLFLLHPSFSFDREKTKYENLTEENEIEERSSCGLHRTKNNLLGLTWCWARIKRITNLDFIMPANIKNGLIVIQFDLCKPFLTMLPLLLFTCVRTSIVTIQKKCVCLETFFYVFFETLVPWIQSHF